MTAEKFVNLKKMKIPSVVVSLTLILMEHIIGALRATFVLHVTFIVYILSVIYIIIGILVGLFYTITGIRIFRFLKASLINDSATSILRRMSILLAASGMGFFLFVIASIFTALALIDNWPPRVFAAFTTIIFIGLDIASITQILSFISPHERPSTEEKRETELDLKENSSSHSK